MDMAYDAKIPHTLRANYKAQSLPMNKRKGSLEESDTPPKVNIAPEKTVVGRLLSY